MSKLKENCANTTLNFNGKLLSLDKPVVMGIINLTPDSFYTSSRAQSIEQAVAKARLMLEDGASILDLGGFSTRPGSENVSQKEEIDRLIPVIKEIRNHYPQALLSVDTFRPAVAKKAIEYGASMINDITGGANPNMIDVIAEYNVPYIIMHMRGSVTDMMANTHYDNLLTEIVQYFAKRLSILHERNITDVIIDPGFGFSKTLVQNYEILKNLTYFEALAAPLLVGISRKSMIYKVLGVTPNNALTGTIAANTLALEKGARILRVHDVKEAVETVKIYNKLKA